MQKREVTVDSYSETISSDSSSDDRTITAETEDSISSMEDNIEDNSCIKETNATEIEASLHQIAECCRRIYVLSFPYNQVKPL